MASFKAKKREKNKVYGTFGTIITWKEDMSQSQKRRFGQRSFKEMHVTAKISKTKVFEKLSYLFSLTTARFGSCKKFLLWVDQPFPLPFPSCLSELSAAVTTKQTNLRTIMLPVSSFPLTATYSFNATLVSSCQSVTLQESRVRQTHRWGKPEWYIPAATAHWLTWGLRAW